MSGYPLPFHRRYGSRIRRRFSGYLKVGGSGAARSNGPTPAQANPRSSVPRDDAGVIQWTARRTRASTEHGDLRDDAIAVNGDLEIVASARNIPQIVRNDCRAIRRDRGCAGRADG